MVSCGGSTGSVDGGCEDGDWVGIEEAVADGDGLFLTSRLKTCLPGCESEEAWGAA